MKTNILLTSFFLSIFTIGCKDDAKESNGGACTTVLDCNAGFDCVFNMCTPAGATTDTDSAGTTGVSASTTTSTSSSTTSTTGDTTDDSKGETTGNDTSCPDGDQYCACHGDGSCNQDGPIPLICFDANDVCIEDPCPAGTEGCACDMGTTGCDSPLDCVNGFCTDQSVGPCEGAYDTCSAAMGLTCCEGFKCVGNDAMAEYFECVPGCSTHSECPAQCCTKVQNTEGYFCAVEAAFCQDNGFCIDSCIYAGDGDCDDGGPGSDFSICDLGTDCEDCGVRY